MDPITLNRLAYIASSGFENEGEASAALLDTIQRLGSELAESDALSVEQRNGIRGALKDIPETFGFFCRITEHYSEEQKANIRFMLVKMMDDLLSLGSVAMLGKEMKVGFSALERSQKGGKNSGATRREKGDLWKATAAQMAKEIRGAHPGWSQDDVSSEIIALWKEEEPPGHTSVKGLISRMERDDELPRAVRSTKLVQVTK
jgi:hypothetical protein